MSIDYHLHEYRLASGSDYRARVQYRQTIDYDGMLDLMQAQHPDLSPAEARVVFDVFIKTLLPLLMDGNRVVTPFGTFGITLKGNFNALTDKFDARKHRFEITIKPAPKLQKAFARQAHPHKVETPKRVPKLDEYIHVADPAAYNQLSPGHMARLLGNNLKFNPDDPEQGIFLLAMKNGRRDAEQLPIRIAQIGTNKSKELLFLIPADLPPNVYQLEVRARFGKHLRIGQLSRLLMVT
ncbi:MAG: DUF4469 domain-containing protein [Anaerolineae bacterium]|nr:DUF4469 domain-containing protein [Anaerolineae bacterium]